MEQMVDIDTPAPAAPAREPLELRLCRIRTRHRTLIETHDLLMEEIEALPTGDSAATQLLIRIGQRLLDKAKDVVEEMATLQSEIDNG